MTDQSSDLGLGSAPAREAAEQQLHVHLLDILVDVLSLSIICTTGPYKKLKTQGSTYDRVPRETATPISLSFLSGTLMVRPSVAGYRT